MFVVLIAIGLHDFLTKPHLSEAQEGSPHERGFFWSVALILLSLAVRYFLGTHIHSHSTYDKELKGRLRFSFVKDLIFRTTMAVWLVMMAVSHDFKQFVLRTAGFSLVGFVWSLTVPMFAEESSAPKHWKTWAGVNFLEVVAAGSLWYYIVHNGETFRASLVLAIVYGITFLVDVFRMEAS